MHNLTTHRKLPGKSSGPSTSLLTTFSGFFINVLDGFSLGYYNTCFSGIKLYGLPAPFTESGSAVEA